MIHVARCVALSLDNFKQVCYSWNHCVNFDDSKTPEACAQLRLIAPIGSLRYKIVILLASGRPRKSIAIALGRSVHTINDHLKEIYRTTGVGDRVLLAALVRAAFNPPHTVRGWLARTV